MAGKVAVRVIRAAARRVVPVPAPWGIPARRSCSRWRTSWKSTGVTCWRRRAGSSGSRRAWRHGEPARPAASHAAPARAEEDGSPIGRAAGARGGRRVQPAASRADPVPPVRKTRAGASRAGHAEAEAGAEPGAQGRGPAGGRRAPPAAERPGGAGGSGADPPARSLPGSPGAPRVATTGLPAGHLLHVVAADRDGGRRRAPAFPNRLRG